MYGAWSFLFLLAAVSCVAASEFPERECCDPEYPPALPTIPSTTVITSTDRSGPNLKTAIAILNCLLARQLCFEDPSCSAILEIIPRVCGPELVACSTVTVTKCQAALRTLQAFPFFKPTCLCREPHVDPECNSFRDFLFDHPCVFVLKKEKDPYPVDALPTCNHALSVCSQERKCIKLFEDFKLNCKVRDNKCRMEDRNLCHDSWANLRRSPMFGCICPNNNMKRRCDRIFSVVNHNPCVAQDNTSAASFDYGIANSVVENPLVDAVNGLEAHSNTDHISVSVLKSKGKQFNFSNISYDEDMDNKLAFQNGHRKYPSSTDHGRSEMNEIAKTIFQSTCHLAMESCNNNYNCRMAMAPILHHCDLSRCNRNSCMEALQAFYRKTSFPWNLEIAFCLCKKTDNKQDTCMLAQQRLHPVCAQRIEGSPQPTCLSVAEVCREDKECRSRLEYYEQSCAVDSVTKKCAGPPSECRAAMLGILGTDLRTTCACKGTDMTQLYECLGWQRLLWVNPCVVEAQKDFHRKKAEERAVVETTVPTTTTTTRHTPAHNIMEYPMEQITVVSYTQASVQTRGSTAAEYVAPPIAPTTTTTTTTTTRTTTTTIGTTTVPPRYCIFQRHDFPDQYIKEGTLKRIYHEDESDCSEICKCGKPEELVCKTMCVDRMPCKSEFAFYNHAAPAFQAYRGRCLCYSGRFICMKPAPGDYNLPQGIFLFLGYSEVDEQQLKNHTEIVVQDVVHALQEFILREAVNGTLCALQLYNVTTENVIIAGKLSSDEVDYNMLSPKESLAKEKEECAELLELVSERINSHNPDFSSHLLLSIFKMAEVEIIQIETNSASDSIRSKLYLILISQISLIVLERLAVRLS
uniref:GDNF/GAS1 domain-containing protein n=2 Tax=Photinus pyralis TaxID=7054 RepID=A0A1Y1NG70_PHOPY